MKELYEILKEIQESYNYNGSQTDKSNLIRKLWTKYYILSNKLNIKLDEAYNLYLLGENESYIIDAIPTKKNINNQELQEALNNYYHNNYLTHKEVKLILDSVINFTWSSLELLGINLDNNSLNGYCELAQALSILPLETIGLKNTKNSASECFKYPFNHKFGTVTFTEKNNDKIEEKTYLIDPTYRQFFTSIRCNEGRYYTKEENTNKIANPDPGYFIEDISFAKELITNGYIELTKENSIKYGEPFYLSSLPQNKLNNKTNIDYYKNIITSTEKYTISRDEIEEFNYNYLNNLITNKRKK